MMEGLLDREVDSVAVLGEIEQHEDEQESGEYISRCIENFQSVTIVPVQYCGHFIGI
ncbi:hypothetical protein IV498_12520 [Paenarthrobacter sp. Z7-10]|uniref:hypothetical protein n=1 Tax=Paenarthrobacter sp. Z7-10 TaxID=2787635 RepID=UPI0022A9663B|nr:hypothetical protein [Paenarthrobacter sp. Z7-10]MCZ2403981.1 hypothetical protein [Paenarthrobacter sp. Z7-10]